MRLIIGLSTTLLLFACSDNTVTGTGTGTSTGMKPNDLAIDVMVVDAEVDTARD